MVSRNQSQSAGKSNRAKREERARQQKPVLIVFSIVLIVLLCAVALILFSLIADRNKDRTDPPVDNTPQETSAEEQTDKTNPDPNHGNQTTSYDYISMESSKDREGTLILINGTHTYDATLASGLISMGENMPKASTGGNMYQLSTFSQKLNRDALMAFNKMMTDFYAAKKDTQILVNSSYRTAEEQSSLSIPVGQSDHHSGYLVSLRYMNSKTQAVALSDEYYRWFGENAYKYGFVIRYPEGKESQTGVSDYKNALRYVGIPHAYYMHQNNLCLEEYVELLKQNYLFEAGEHLRFTTDGGTTYEIYYVPAPGELTSVPIPKNYSYEISGTNDSGFVITVTRN